MIDKPKSSKKSTRIKLPDRISRVDRYIPCWNERIIRLAKPHNYWKRFKVGNRTFTKSTNPGRDYLVLEIKKMTQQEYNIIRDDLKWK